MNDTWQSIEQAAVTLGLSVRTVNRHMAAGKLASRLNADGRREVLVQLKPEPENSGPFADDVLAGRVGHFERPPHPAMPSDNTVSASAVDLSATPVDLKKLSDQLGQLDSQVTQVVADEHAVVGRTPEEKSLQAARSYDSETLLVLADSAADKMERAIGAYQVLARTAVAQAEAGRRGSRIAWSAVGVMAVAIVAAIGWTTYYLTHAQSDMTHLADQAKSATDNVKVVTLERDSLRTELTKSQQTAAKLEGRLSAIEEADRQRKDTRPTTRPALGDQLSSYLFGN